MAISKTDICNKALTQLGAAPITNIDDNTNNANILSRVYEIALKSVLAECKWNFATKRRLLSVSTYDPEWDYDDEAYVYARPADIVRIFESNDEDATWREEGDYIISDTAGLGIAYVYYLDTPSKYPIFFVDALVDKLASDIAYMIINSATKAEQMIAKYEKVSLPKAIAQNSQIGKQQTLKDDAWELSRLSNGSLDS